MIALVTEYSGVGADPTRRFLVGVLVGLSTAALLVAAYAYFREHGSGHRHTTR